MYRCNLQIVIIIALITFFAGYLVGHRTQKIEANVHAVPITIEEFANHQPYKFRANLMCLAVIHRAEADDDAGVLLYPLAKEKATSMVTNIISVEFHSYTDEFHPQFQLAP